jgi:SAM-dependent methyltransferase
VGYALDLGCGTGSRDRDKFKDDIVDEIAGIDVSQKCLEEARLLAKQNNFRISYRKEDINEIDLEKNQFDFIFSCHSFHHFFKLEHIMKEVSKGLKDHGLFILEEYIGPSRFQWNRQQLELINNMLTLIPKKYRKYKSGFLKKEHWRPTPEEVRNVSPFEAIRSSDIIPLFYKYFDVLHHKNLGGTIQHLLYMGIIHNFDEREKEANEIIRCIDKLETILIENKEILSGFALLVGKKKL